ncbi:pimeloyl-ACP methyl ester carboxylesterase [Curtobacterium sp. PhB130]|uniref:alpha/beta fold hydrolase n=1 Tax=Curtobacterium sp. PhB130 TaxID=2485178 RepID=UPI000FB271E2|nr:alpha/beta hydrolase [Curtobacterium sp. PhB130]ROS74066.1 pimeloyl-ACP methyl ester carboxylesterase [Curtobacterium sp. PhB130]
MDATQQTVTTPDGTAIAVTRRHGGGQAVVFLHAGVADRRSWDAVAALLNDDDDDLDLVAYDRRGYGETPAAADPASFTHAADLLTVLDALGLDRVFLVGNSMGGALALDAALLLPERVTGLLLIGAGVSGMTDDDTPFDWELDPATEPLLDRAEDASADVEARIAALAHLWLDGPVAPEGRVGGAPRELFADMNRRILEVGAPDSAGDNGIEAWTRLGEVSAPVTCTWGDLDIPADLPFYAEIARRLDQGPARVLPGVAHLPGLEQPDLVAGLVRDTLPR